MEGAHFKATGKLESFSAQQLVDCSTYNNDGCKMGHPMYSYDYLQWYPAQLAKDYKYTSG